MKTMIKLLDLLREVEDEKDFTEENKEIKDLLKNDYPTFIEKLGDEIK